ncbi:170 kDa surface lectin precursor, putative [Entamoeba invadens IP1]|uniref:170 kDa surface lectin, putative n=1 Tax=Entamoeba invadens IP1 TaxID=370355 RepID=A0A0A1UGS5_ENTIV|nr:170 kDa surface lectin precursor, putative [Entamoeba invadens IP1]ELP95109.1 170 kDa surface lectin precursor, putative [Entamoeba invadens IP1]|eukprot:XP_004261880.1 170 kDa surface lectin precursor, putative [Entamoeba invadens IP1]
MYLLFTLAFGLFASAISLNEFTGTVDIQDPGRMGMGKNAASWVRSYSQKYEVFYYLTMQPWRHMEWTTIDKNMPATDNLNDIYTQIVFNQDYGYDKDDTTGVNMCRKKIGYPMRKFVIDWSLVPSDTSRIEKSTINGLTCYKYAARPPLQNVYLLEKVYNNSNAYGEGYTPCRLDFIGGKSITFRSASEYTPTFVNEFQANNITKCKRSAIYPIQSDIAVGLMINLDSTNTLRSFMNSIASSFIEQFSSSTKFSIYANSRSVYKSTNLLSKSEAKTFLNQITSLAASSAEEGLKYVYSQIANFKGKNLVFLTKSSSSSEQYINSVLNKGTSGNMNMTVYVVNYDSSVEEEYNLQKLVDKGEHYIKIDSQNMDGDMKMLYNTIIANMTELCDRTKCNGFCDGGARCICPMCCHNKCYYTKCETSTGTCVKFPTEAPMLKLKCSSSDCLGDYQCDEEFGCVLKTIKPQCQTSVKCLAPYCQGNTCLFKDNCQADAKPSSDGYCHTYKCNQGSGECVSNAVTDYNKCPTTKGKCQEFYCDSNAQCKTQPKQCVKVSPYQENPCYIATCDETSGTCLTKLNCDSNRPVCGTNGGSCKCNENTNYQCQCQNDGTCNTNEVCDLTGSSPECNGTLNKCGITGNLEWKGCYKTVCKYDSTNGTYYTEQEEYKCDTYTIPEECKGLVKYICSGEKECNRVTTDSANEQCLDCVDGKKVDKCEGKTTSQGVPLTCQSGECKEPPTFNCSDLFKNTTNPLKLCEKNYQWKYENGICFVEVIDPSLVLNNCEYCEYDNIFTKPAQYIELKCDAKKNPNGIPYGCDKGKCVIEDYDCSKHEDFPTNCKDIYDYKLITTGEYDDYKCEWNINEVKYKSTCQLCDLTVVGGKIYDKCALQSTEELDVKCNTIDGECDYHSDCKKEKCFIKTSSPNGNCDVVTTTSICPENVPEKDGEVVCKKSTCSADGQSCSVAYDDTICASSTAEIGCSYLPGTCNRISGYCDKVAITECSQGKDAATRMCDNKCFAYNCTEKLVDNKLTHEWITIKDYVAQAERMSNKCLTATCDAVTGEIMTETVTCDIDAEFPNMSKYAKLCFYCECSVVSESGWVLAMFSDYENNTFSLDACGNCIVNGEIQDKTATCVLYNQVDNKAAIAAATTVAAVVAALVIGLVIIGITIKKTYDVVRNAMKNTVDNAVVNPQFIEKDSNAQNANFET